MNTFLRTTLPMVAALWMFGCGDDDEPAYESSCTRDCARLHDCSSTVDVESCASDCGARLADVGPQLRREYLNGIDSCVEELSCNELAAASLSNTCPMESAAKLAPSQAAQNLCDKVRDSYEECLGVSGDGSTCLETMKVFADGPLNAAARCVKEPCDQRARCLQETLGVSVDG